MSGKKNVTQPCAEAGSTPATCSTLPCAKCIGCVVSATIENIKPLTDPTQFGHSFDFIVVSNYSAGTGGRARSDVEWWERCDFPAEWLDIEANTWTEMRGVKPDSGCFTEWHNRVTPCPGGGAETVKLNDTPFLTVRPGLTVTRTLEFRLVAWSGDCGCPNSSLIATATQVLEMVNGVPGNSSFTLGIPEPIKDFMG